MGLHRVGHDWSNLAAATGNLLFFCCYSFLKCVVMSCAVMQRRWNNRRQQQHVSAEALKLPSPGPRLLHEPYLLHTTGWQAVTDWERCQSSILPLNLSCHFTFQQHDSLPQRNRLETPSVLSFEPLFVNKLRNQNRSLYLMHEMKKFWLFRVSCDSTQISELFCIVKKMPLEFLLGLNESTDFFV